MTKKSHSREDGQQLLCNYIEEVQRRTNHGPVLSSEVFKGKLLNGEIVPLSQEFEKSKIHSLIIFVEAGLIKILSKFGKRSYYIEWCGRNAPIEDITKIYLNALKKHVAKKRDVVDETEETAETQPVDTTNILNQEFVPISYKEFKENFYNGAKEDTIAETLSMLNETYKHTKDVPQTSHNVFKMELPGKDGVLEMMDVREMYVSAGKPKNSILTIALLVKVLALRKVDDLYQWNTKKPDVEMVKIICGAFSYYNYISIAERKFNEAKAKAVEAEKARIAEAEIEKARIAEAEAEKTRIAKEEADVIAEIEAETTAKLLEEVVMKVSPKLHEKEFEVSSDDTKTLNYDKMSDRELIIFVCKKAVSNEEYQIKLSNNIIALLKLFEKSDF